MPDSHLLDRFSDLLMTIETAGLEREIAIPDRLLVASADHRGKHFDVAYAPFDYVNKAARIVIVGLTPGRQQMRNALMEARRVLQAGGTSQNAMEAAKVFASFSGPMRSNLVAMLDHVGVQNLLGIASAASLWSGDSALVHFTSALRYPTFRDGRNYDGNPAILSTPLLAEQLDQWFVPEMKALPDAVFVPLGPEVGKAVRAAAATAGIDLDRVLAGLPHPSSANAERIAFFLDRKDRESLSVKTSPDLILGNRSEITKKVAALSAA